MSIVLDTPAQISMWVLLSRRSQVRMHLKGVKTNGLVKWCRENIEGCEAARTVKDCIVPVELAIQMAGGPADYSLVNVHVCNRRAGLWFDQGIFPDMDSASANPNFIREYQEGKLSVTLTLDAPREATNQIMMEV